MTIARTYQYYIFLNCEYTHNKLNTTATHACICPQIVNIHTTTTHIKKLDKYILNYQINIIIKYNKQLTQHHIFHLLIHHF